jgi:hypothetical protein
MQLKAGRTQFRCGVSRVLAHVGRGGIRRKGFERVRFPGREPSTEIIEVSEMKSAAAVVEENGEGLAIEGFEYEIAIGVAIEVAGSQALCECFGADGDAGFDGADVDGDLLNKATAFTTTRTAGGEVGLAVAIQVGCHERVNAGKRRSKMSGMRGGCGHGQEADRQQGAEYRDTVDPGASHDNC